jgi:hypothetical protein
MIELKREIFLEDPVFKQLYEKIRQNHKVASHTERELKENRQVKDFCVESRHFAELPGKDPIYLSYDVSSWFKKPNGVMIKIDCICVYDSFLEYEISRTKQLSSTNDSEDYRSN